MSADSWAVCPRCNARGDLGIRGSDFREDYGIYGAETGTVTVEYRGECQKCGLLLEFTAEHPIPDWQPANEPIGPELQSQWDKVPAGWFVQTPRGDWWEVLATERVPSGQRVAMRSGGNRGEWTRDPKGEVWARRGSTAPRDRDDALGLLESAFQATILRDEPPGQS